MQKDETPRKVAQDFGGRWGSYRLAFGCFWNICMVSWPFASPRGIIYTAAYTASNRTSFNITDDIAHIIS